MKYVYLVLGKQSKESYNYWITSVCSSEAKAKKLVESLNRDQGRFGFHYYIKEPVE